MRTRTSVMEIDVGTIIRLKSKRDAAGPVSEKETSPIQTEEQPKW